ncbi:cytochrome c [Novosphingobium sp. PhB57]|uniref:c-type cytochrome n=1 Tax=Novosphingobium sp. PhB57 TaxID=2485107 RepID=UPI00104A7A41|nr:c-type cytochrome [Novosphingobium sp. PhB57]TCU54623.1 cytochrome c [Novosphingobium sp. PhB57]
MARQQIPPSLWWLILLIALCVFVAVITGAGMYFQTQARHRDRAEMITGGDRGRGHMAIERYACGSCHVIPGIDGAIGKVGPDLSHVGQRAALAGSLTNDPATMTAWLLHPQKLRPGSGMPEQAVRPREARDMAAYLYAQN